MANVCEVTLLGICDLASKKWTPTLNSSFKPLWCLVAKTLVEPHSIIENLNIVEHCYLRITPCAIALAVNKPNKQLEAGDCGSIMEKLIWVKVGSVLKMY